MTETNLSVTITENLAGERLDRALAELCDDLSRSRLKSLIEEGAVHLQETPITSAATKVRCGQTFAIVIPEPRPTALEGQKIDLEVLFEDEEIIVINKPAGLVVHPGAGNPDGTLVNALIAHCGDSLKGIGGEQRPGIVHRLDKDTSGVMIAAKTSTAHAELVRQFSERLIDRRYRALVWGRPSPSKGAIEGNIGRSGRDRTKMTVMKSGGRPALTHYEVVRSFARTAVSEVVCKLMTGRTHQIRVHLSEKGHPLLGDPLYGRESRARRRALDEVSRTTLEKLGRQALHAELLGITHPKSGKEMQFKTDLPDDINGLIDCLEML